MNKFVERFRQVFRPPMDSVGNPYSTRADGLEVGFAGTWIDVGAHLGETTFKVAQNNPSLHVFAFEPNLKLASQRWGILPNFTVLPFAIAETDGFAYFHLNANDGASSLLPFNPDGLRRWLGGETLRIESRVMVPCMRLDTFMSANGIAGVDFLKVDAQGSDLAVIKSAGDRIREVKKITLEVAITSVPLYEGACRRPDIFSYLGQFGFTLTGTETQSYDQEQNLTFVSEVAP
jgi:FkbM family methyltransferase